MLTGVYECQMMKYLYIGDGLFHGCLVSYLRVFDCLDHLCGLCKNLVILNQFMLNTFSISFIPMPNKLDIGWVCGSEMRTGRWISIVTLLAPLFDCGSEAAEPYELNLTLKESRLLTIRLG